MRKTIALLGAAFIAALTFGCAQAADPEASTVRLVTQDSANRQSLCTAVIINNTGLAVTAKHCVSGKLTAILRSGLIMDAHVVRIHESQDVALIQLDPKRRYVYTVMRCEQRAVRGEFVSTIGMPAGLFWVSTYGYIAGNDETYDYLNMAIWHGNSGGGVFDRQGRLVGVVSAYYAQRNDQISHIVVGLAVPIKAACDLVKNG